MRVQFMLAVALARAHTLLHPTPPHFSTPPPTTPTPTHLSGDMVPALVFPGLHHLHEHVQLWRELLPDVMQQLPHALGVAQVRALVVHAEGFGQLLRWGWGPTRCVCGVCACVWCVVCGVCGGGKDESVFEVWL